MAEPVRVIPLHTESIEHFRAETRPLLDYLKAFFGWPGDPIVTARSVVGDFFEGIRDPAERAAAWDRCAAALPVPVEMTDRCLDVARRLAAG